MVLTHTFFFLLYQSVGKSQKVLATVIWISRMDRHKNGR